MDIERHNNIGILLMKTLSLLLIPAFVLAMPVKAANKWASEIQIERLQMYDADNVVVVPVPSDFPAGCTNTENPKRMWITIGEAGVDQVELERMYSMLLTAVVSGNKVTLRWNDSTNNCYISRTQIFNS